MPRETMLLYLASWSIRKEDGMELEIIDNHVHIAGKGDCYPADLHWSKRFTRGIGYRSLIILKGWIFKKVGDERMIETVVDQVERAGRIGHAVLLAFDNVYDPDGTCRGPSQQGQAEVLSTIYVSNDLVKRLSKEHPKILMGISVHPFRNDAIEELEKYKDKAALCKWMPSAQLIDFENPDVQGKLGRFYAKLAEIRLPLLLHTGIETTIPAPRDGYEKFNNPLYIKKALDMGVTVILAHCGCSFFDATQDDFLDEALGLFRKRVDDHPDWNLYADISALFSPFRARKVLKRIFETVPADRLIYGSDFPNPAKGRKEPLLRPFLRFSRRNLLNRSARVAYRWLKYYYREEENKEEKIQSVMMGFHRLLTELGRAHILTP